MICHIKYSQSVCEVDNIPILEINKKKKRGGVVKPEVPRLVSDTARFKAKGIGLQNQYTDLYRICKILTQWTSHCLFLKKVQLLALTAFPIVVYNLGFISERLGAWFSHLQVIILAIILNINEIELGPVVRGACIVWKWLSCIIEDYCVRELIIKLKTRKCTPHRL